MVSMLGEISGADAGTIIGIIICDTGPICHSGRCRTGGGEVFEAMVKTISCTSTTKPTFPK